MADLNDHNLSLEAYGLLAWLKRQRATPDLDTVHVIFPNTPDTISGAIAELQELGLISTHLRVAR